MSEFLFLRHGRTGYNFQRLMQGHLDIPLDATGREQARAAADTLHASGRRVARIAASDLSRAHETATIVGARTGAPVSLDDDLRERCFGPLEGGSIFDGVWESRVEGVEPIEAFAARIADAVRRCDTPETLFVAHGGVLRVLCHILGAELPDGGLANALPLLFARGPGGWRVGEVAMLQAAVAAEPELGNAT